MITIINLKDIFQMFNYVINLVIKSLLELYLLHFKFSKILNHVKLVIAEIPHTRCTSIEILESSSVQLGIMVLSHLKHLFFYSFGVKMFSPP